MPALLSKPLNEKEKDEVHKRLCQMAFMGVMTQNIQSFMDTQLITEAVKGDPGRAAAILAATSSVGGFIEFILNPIVGKLTDEHGRKPVYYTGPVLSGILMSLAVIATKGKSLPVLFAHKAMSWSLISMSLSFIVPITLSDIFSGQELGARVARFFGSIGFAIIFAPAAGAMIMKRSSNPMNVFKFRILSAILQLALAYRIPETLASERQRPFKLTDVNPIGFLKLFQKSHTLKVLSLTNFFMCFAEGKNVVPLMQGWMNGIPLKWPLGKQSGFTILYGVLAVLAGFIGAPALIKKLGPRGFTSATNSSNAVGLALIGLPAPTYDVASYLGMILHGPGINNTSAAAVKAMATDHAVAAGLARGEYGGMYSSLRTLSMIIAPPLFSFAYQKGGKSQIPGFAWMTVALTGAVLPELLHRSLSDKDLKLPPEPAKS